METLNEENKSIDKINTWDYSDTKTDYVHWERVTMLKPTARNMHVLMNKINELVDVINELKQK